MKSSRVWLLSLGFDVWWTLAVWGRERLILPLLVSSLLMLALTPSRRRLWVAIACALGITMDSLWGILGLFEFTHASSVPPWMMALWLGFSAWWLWLLENVPITWYWLIPLGALSGPLAYYLGMRFGAMHLLASASDVWLLLAAGWAIYLPLISLPVSLVNQTRRRS